MQENDDIGLFARYIAALTSVAVSEVRTRLAAGPNVRTSGTAARVGFGASVTIPKFALIKFVATLCGLQESRHLAGRLKDAGACVSCS